MEVNFPEYLNDLFDAIVPVGSRITCNPPPMDTDQDLLCYCSSVGQYVESCDILAKCGWEEAAGEKYDDMAGDFTSWRKGELNIILTYNQEFFKDFIQATKECKRLNLLDKKDRIAKFDEMFGRSTPSQEEKKEPLNNEWLKAYQSNLVFQLHNVEKVGIPPASNWAAAVW